MSLKLIEQMCSCLEAARVTVLQRDPPAAGLQALEDQSIISLLNFTPDLFVYNYYLPAPPHESEA